MPFLSLLSLRRLAKECKVKRISRDALEELRFLLEGEAKEIATAAVEFCSFAGRRTVLARDVRLALKKLRRDVR